MKNAQAPVSQSSPVGKTDTSIKIAVIGLGYVGLPLARLFATKYPVVGFDVNRSRVEALQDGHDSTQEVSDEVLQHVLLKSNPLGENSLNSENSSSSAKNGLFCTPDIMDIQECNYFVITVPTPVDKNRRPILDPLYAASETVGKVLKVG